MRILDSTFAASIILFYGVENMNITTIRYQIQRKTDGLKPKVILNPNIKWCWSKKGVPAVVVD